MQVSFKILVIISSTSIAITWPAFLHSSRVKTPRPGPTSITRSFFDRSAASIILSKVHLSTKKFWPLRLSAQSLCFDRICVTSCLSVRFIKLLYERKNQPPRTGYIISFFEIKFNSLGQPLLKSPFQSLIWQHNLGRLYNLRYTVLDH